MPNDDDLWQLYAKSVKRIAQAKRTATSNQTASSRRKPGSSRNIHLEMTPPISKREAAWMPAFAGMTQSYDVILDRRVEKNLRQGTVALQARIDLHGKTQAEAYEALARFIAAAVKSGKRNLLIITGKGKANAGVLKTNLPDWLQSLPQATQILALRTAAPQHGGEGAFYVILRKRAEA